MKKFKDLSVGDKILFLEYSYHYSKEIVKIENTNGNLIISFSSYEGYIFPKESYYYDLPRLGILIPEQNTSLINLFNLGFRKGQEDIKNRFRQLLDIYVEQ